MKKFFIFVYVFFITCFLYPAKSVAAPSCSIDGSPSELTIESSYTINASSVPAGQQFAVRFNPAPGNPSSPLPLNSSGTSDGNGNYSGGFTIPSDFYPGTYSLSLGPRGTFGTAPYCNLTSGNINVVKAGTTIAPPTSTPTPSFSTSCSIDGSPSELTTGENYALTASSLAANQNFFVQLYQTSGSGTGTPIAAISVSNKSDRDGNLKGSFTLPPHTSFGFSLGTTSISADAYLVDNTNLQQCPLSPGTLTINESAAEQTGSYYFDKNTSSCQTCTPPTGLTIDNTQCVFNDLQSCQNFANTIKTYSSVLSPPPPPCNEGKDANGNDTKDAAKIVTCTAVNSAVGPFSTDPGGIIKDLFVLLLGMGGGWAVYLISTSGYELMFSNGNAEQIKEAQDKITSAIVGLIFMILSVAILQIIGVQVFQFPGFGK